MTMTDQFDEWRAEIGTWPPMLRSLAERFPPWAFVRIVSTGAIGKVHGFSERTDGVLTLDVIVRRSWNPDLPSGHPDNALVTGLAVDAIETIDNVH